MVTTPTVSNEGLGADGVGVFVVDVAGVAEGAGRFDGAEAAGEVVPVLQRLEMCFVDGEDRTYGAVGERRSIATAKDGP